ncbi:Pyruvate flavodoxin/ferredoxin oxidoreductase-like protein [candidate division SR1 bacterium RAAC1_SR1_1]|nr:Pyruvate flavodoxin/ferredoxin oxidoreductase-like protein [candidate division SR1 bacterium RAAC1_SR1_1]
MRIAIGFSGAAGSGVNTSGLLLGNLLASKGYTILADKEYASIIKGDNNDFFLYISDQPGEYFLNKTIDFFFAFDDYAVSKNQKFYTLKNTINVKDQICKHKNVFCFGAALKAMNIPLEEGEKLIKEQFSGDKLEDNITDLMGGYGYMQGLGTHDGDRSKTIGEAKTLMFGNECIAKGAIEAGMDFYAAYPMTPASSLIDVVTTDNRVTFFQGEDEIAVSMAMLGAKVAGKRSMCGTSGGGFALMTESISFSNQAEIGGVYVLAQRDGPSTGTPTYTGQADLTYALNASFGDTFPIVLAPSTFEEGYTQIGKALNWSDIYQHPVILLTDKQFSEGYIAINPKDLKAEEIKRGKLVQGSEGYKRYEFTKDGISPWTTPGTENGEFITTSYEHDEYGATNEDPEIKKAMQDKRDQKLKTFIQQEFTEDFYGYEIINPDAEKFFITYGWNRFVLEDYIRNNKDQKIGLIVIKVFQPFDLRLKTFLEQKNSQIQLLIFVEMNASGQLQRLVTEQCVLNQPIREGKLTNHRKYTLYPIFGEEVTL